MGSYARWALLAQFGLTINLILVLIRSKMHQHIVLHLPMVNTRITGRIIIFVYNVTFIQMPLGFISLYLQLQSQTEFRLCAA